MTARWPTRKTIEAMVAEMYEGQTSPEDGIEKRRALANLGLRHMSCDELRRFWLETNGATAFEMGYEK